MPNTPMEKPPSAGPMTRERLNCIEFKAMPCLSCSRSKRSPTKACQAGNPTVLNVPLMSAIRMICQTVIVCNVVERPKNAAVLRKMICVPINRERRLNRSAMTPPKSDKIMFGIVAAKPTRPSRNAEFVNCNTCQLCPTDCIQKPILERDEPNQNKPKFFSFNGCNDGGKTIGRRTEGIGNAMKKTVTNSSLKLCGNVDPDEYSWKNDNMRIEKGRWLKLIRMCLKCAQSWRRWGKG